MNIDYKVAEVELSYKTKNERKHKILTASDIHKMMLPTYREGTIEHKEYFKAVFLNQAQEVLGYTLISEGGITATVADVRIILQAALLTNSVAIILVHNHPSGNLKPSKTDCDLTKQIVNAAKFMDIRVLDHLIISKDDYYSFAEEGQI